MVSFHGARQQLPKTEITQNLVKDHMSRQHTSFHPEQTIEEVVDILLKKKLTGGPVVDESGNLVGIISEGDCLKEVVRGKYNNSPLLSGQVKDYMATDVQVMHPETSIFEAAQTFLDKRLRRFPVMKDGKLLGVISQRDVMLGIRKLKNENWHDQKPS